jgi:hypothetical protein
VNEKALGTARVPITREVRRIVDLLDLAIQRFRLSLATVPPLGKYESHDECLLLVSLISRNVQAITMLARENLALIPPAMVLVRQP